MKNKSITFGPVQAMFCDGTCIDAPQAKSPQSLSTSLTNHSLIAKEPDNGWKSGPFRQVHQCHWPGSKCCIPKVPSCAHPCCAKSCWLIKCPKAIRHKVAYELNVCTTSDHKMTPLTSMFCLCSSLTFGNFSNSEQFCLAGQLQRLCSKHPFSSCQLISCWC